MLGVRVGVRVRETGGRTDGGLAILANRQLEMTAGLRLYSASQGFSATPTAAAYLSIHK